jgi:hypothetical protein
MAEISRDVDERRYRAAITSLARDLLKEDNEGQCVIFLGAGAAIDTSKPHLPTAAELSKELAAECGLEWHEYIPLSTIAFHYEYYFRRSQLNDLLKQRLANPNVEPSTTIQQLVKVVRILESDPKRTVFVVTTNFDQQFERAYQAEFGRPVGVIIYNGGIDANQDVPLHSGHPISSPANWFPRGKTYLYKIHGCISQTGERNLVVTEEDYVNFLSNALSYDHKRRLLQYALGRFSECPILFVGYSLSDWNFRVLFKATAEKYRRDCFAVQYCQETRGPRRTAWNAAVEFWGDRRVDIVNEDGATFMADVLEAVTRECSHIGRAAVVSA